MRMRRRLWELLDAVDASNLPHRLSVTASSWRGAQDDGHRDPFAEALRVALRVERRLVRLGQHEGVVDSEGAEPLAVGQEKAEVLARQGHQLQRDRDAGLGHVVLQSAGRKLEAGRTGAAFEDQVAWRKSIVLPAPVARSDCRKAGICVPWLLALTNKMALLKGIGSSVTPPVSKTSS